MPTPSYLQSLIITILTMSADINGRQNSTGELQDNGRCIHISDGTDLWIEGRSLGEHSDRPFSYNPCLCHVWHSHRKSHWISLDMLWKGKESPG